MATDSQGVSNAVTTAVKADNTTQTSDLEAGLREPTGLQPQRGSGLFGEKMRRKLKSSTDGMMTRVKTLM